MSEKVVSGKTFVRYVSAAEIEKAVHAVAEKMNHDLKDKRPLFIGLLNGAFMFTADLMKLLNFECQLSFVKMSSYAGMQTTGNLTRLIGLNEQIEGHTIVVVEDIVDTGTTLFHFLNELKELKPAEIKVASMFYKPEACRHPIKIDYLGMEIPDDFVIGYGLDYNGFGRNFNELYKLKSNEN